MRRIAVCVVLAALAVVAAVSVAVAAQQQLPIPSSCGGNGAYNTIPLGDASTAVPHSSMQFGKRLTANPGPDNFTILHVYGTPYQMGLAQGTLMRNEIQTLIPAFHAYVAGQIEQFAKRWPTWMVDALAKYGIDFLLDLTISFTKAFTPQYYLDELSGMAAGAGVEMATLWRISLFPEMDRAACTIVGATRSATDTGKITQLRGLDVDPHMPIKNWPQVTVYHFTSSPATNYSGELRYDVANFGWVLLNGALTAMSSAGMAMGEKLWLRPGTGVDRATGVPWMMLMRTALSSYSTTADAVAYFQSKNRTCAIHVGVGDTATNEFRIVDMAGAAFEVWAWNSTGRNWTGHPYIRDVDYVNKHEQPSHDPCLADLLQQRVPGNVTALELIQVSAISATGNLHSVTFDYATMTAYFANARKTNVTSGSIDAYARQWTKINVGKLFAEKL